jgi:hypothetical protein
LEETYMKPIAAQRGAAACLGKPIRIEMLKSTLDAVSAKQSQMLTCHRWGFLIPSPVHEELNVKSNFRGITTKLSGITTKKERGKTNKSRKGASSS